MAVLTDISQGRTEKHLFFFRSIFVFYDDRIVILRKFRQLFNCLRLLSGEAWAESTGQLGASWTVGMFSPAKWLKVACQIY